MNYHNDMLVIEPYATTLYYKYSPLNALYELRRFRRLRLSLRDVAMEHLKLLCVFVVTTAAIYQAIVKHLGVL